jgi:hypothetical protein
LGRVLLTAAAHYSEVAMAWELGIGLTISALFGALYANAVRRSLGDALWHGGMVAGIAAFLGTAVAVTLADRAVADLLWASLAAFAAGSAAGATAHLSPGAASRI